MHNEQAEKKLWADLKWDCGSAGSNGKSIRREVRSRVVLRVKVRSKSNFYLEHYGTLSGGEQDSHQYIDEGEEWRKVREEEKK